MDDFRDALTGPDLNSQTITDAPSESGSEDRSAREETIRISEIFGPTIQGEGALIGQPTLFVRAGGCDFRCSWCDSLHAVDPRYRRDWTPMTDSAILAALDRLAAVEAGGRLPIVSLSGGNPALQPFGSLIRKGKARGYRFAMESQGSISRPWFRDLDMLVLSPKPPSSGMAEDKHRLQDCLDAAGDGVRTVLKFVIFDEADYRFAREISARFQHLPVTLQPGNQPAPVGEEDSTAPDYARLQDKMTWLVDRVMADRWYDATILPQLHVMIWGNRRGV